MIASVHVADVGVPAGAQDLPQGPAAGSIAGLRNANVAFAAPLGGSVMPSPQFGRAGLVAFWDDDDALDRFLADDPLAAKFASGWHVRLAPLRAHGTWPGLPSDTPEATATSSTRGPVAALTMGVPVRVS